MKKKSTRAIALLMVIAILISTIPAFANFTTAALITNDAEGYNWMGKIADSTKLCDISIPGSHDSGARSTEGYASPWAKTQDLTISEQLNAGVRMLDLRLRYNADVSGEIQIVHSSIATYDENGNPQALSDVIQILYYFLMYNPTETVIVSFKEDDGSNESKIVSKINSYISSNSSRWYQSYNTPTLGDVRGKIVVASRMSTLRGLLLNSSDQGSDGGYAYDQYKNLYYQDRYNMGTENKWNNAVVPLLDMKKPDGAWSINYLSTTGANINGVSSNANIMNQHFNDYGASNNKCYGIIMFDYVTDGLCKKVFKCNDLVAKNQPDPTQGQYYYRLNWVTNEAVGSGWSSVSLKINYRTNNGTGTSSSVLIFDQSDKYNGYQFVCNAENFDFSGWLPGYPTSVEFSYDFGYGAHTLDITQRFYVGKSPKDTLRLVASNDFRNSSYIGKACKGTENYNVSPASTPASLPIKDSSDAYVDVPDRSSSSYATVNIDATVLDQYGVNWYDNNYTLVLDKSYSGVRVSGKSIIIDKDANSLADGTEIYVSARYSYYSTTLVSPVKKRIVLNILSFPYKFVNDDGTVLQEGTGQIGDVITYTGETPTKSSTEDYHYTFRAFSSNTITNQTGNTFKATYTAGKHVFYEKPLFSIPAACKREGTDLYSCGCGYARSVKNADPLGHFYVFNGEKDENGIHFGCKHCSNIEAVSKENIFQIWSIDLYNTRNINRSGAEDTDKTSMLDMNGDGIINAKDYAMIAHQ